MPNAGGRCGNRTHWPYSYDLQFSKLLHYHPAHLPNLGASWENQTPTSSFVAMCNIHFTKAVKNLVEDKGIEPLTHACKAHVFPLAPIPRILGITNFSRISYADTESTSLMHRFTRQHCWFDTPWWCDSGVGDRDRTCIVLICNQLPSLSAHTHINKTWRCVGESNSRLRIDNPR